MLDARVRICPRARVSLLVDEFGIVRTTSAEWGVERLRRVQGGEVRR
jgi:hypothetical protein